jgi:predicted  nucleic acid-binding Zn-ribbon protein
MKEREPISRRVIRRLEDEIVSLDRDYTALLRKKWLLEEKMREQKDQIAELEITTHSEVKKRSFWKKVAIVLVASWGVFLSLCGFDRK